MCYDNLDNNQPSTLLFIDIKKAFDSVSRKKLSKKLDFCGIRGVANSLLSSYLTGRTQYVSFASTTSTKKQINYGIPQGSILGPLFFLIYLNDLPSCLDTTPRFFADDTALLITGKDFDSMDSLANLELFKVSKWMMSNNLIANASKTVALPLSIGRNTRNPNSDVTFVLDGQTLNPTTSARYLGIIIDDHLLFKSHVDHLENIISRSVGVIAKLSYYLPHNTLITLYYTLIQSHLLYDLPVWASTYKTYLLKLKKLQNKALRIILKCPIRSNKTPQYYKFKILKLEDLYNLEIAKFMHKFSPKKLPINFNDYFNCISEVSSHKTRHVSDKNIFLLRAHTSRSQRSIKYTGAKI